MRSPYETKIILLLKATALAGALAARHECPGARPFPSAPTQRLFLSLATREVLIGGLPAGERDLTGVVIRRQQVPLLAGSVHPVHVPPSVDEALGPDCTQDVGRASSATLTALARAFCQRTNCLTLSDAT